MDTLFLGLALATSLCLASIGPAAAMPELSTGFLEPTAVLPPGADLPAPLTGLTIGSMHVRFGVTTLNEIQDVMGDGAIVEQSRTGRHLLCYSIPTGNTWERLWLISKDRSGGIDIDLRVSEIQAVQARTNALSLDCPVPSASYHPLHFDRGLWLGEPRQGLIELLGRPAQANGGEWSYVYDSPQSGRQGSHHVVSLVQAQLDDGKVSAIVASQIATY